MMLRAFVLSLFLSIPYFLLAQAFKIDEFQLDSNFYQSEKKTIKQIVIVGNKTTKSIIISRELNLKVGDTIDNNLFIEKLAQAKKNLLNTSLFNFAKLELAYIKPEEVIIIITVTERWYIFPLPIFEIDDNNFNTWWRDRDYSRINYGMQITHNNFRGRKEKLSITAKYGFTERYRIRYTIPYLNKKQKSGLSFSFSYNRRDEVTYNTLDNERLQYKNEDRDAFRNYSGGISYRYRKAIYNTHSISINYDHNSVVDSVTILNPNFLGGHRNRLTYLNLNYSFTHDKRDSRNYPLKGRFLRASVRKIGLGISNQATDLTEFQLEVKKFQPITNRLFWAGSFRGFLSANNNQPYLLQRGLGYNSFSIRSYEFYVIDGQNIGLAKTQLKYQVVKPNSLDIGFLSEKIGKFHYAFYLGLFTDFAYVQDNIGFPQNNLANQIQFGSGIGLDFVSYYDIVIRTELSINKFGEHGLFIHFVAPI